MPANNPIFWKILRLVNKVPGRGDDAPGFGGEVHRESRGGLSSYGVYDKSNWNELKGNEDVMDAASPCGGEMELMNTTCVAFLPPESVTETKRSESNKYCNFHGTKGHTTLISSIYHPFLQEQGPLGLLDERFRSYARI